MDFSLGAPVPKKQECLDEHHRLSNLFVENRSKFEEERKNIIELIINNIDDARRKNKLRQLQKRLDLSLG